MVVSGIAVNSMVTFPVGQGPQILPTFDITNDDAGLETVEEYKLELFSSSPSDNVNLGKSTNISITNDDSK